MLQLAVLNTVQIKMKLHFVDISLYENSPNGSVVALDSTQPEEQTHKLTRKNSSSEGNEDSETEFGEYHKIKHKTSTKA